MLRLSNGSFTLGLVWPRRAGLRSPFNMGGGGEQQVGEWKNLPLRAFLLARIYSCSEPNTLDFVHLERS